MLVAVAGCSSTEVPAATRIVPMPNVVGQKLTDAENPFDQWIWNDTGPKTQVEGKDFPPLNRDLVSHAWWTVMATTPAAGEVLREGDDVVLYVLRHEEAEWFAVNATMPALRGGVSLEQVSLDDTWPLKAVQDLVLWRYPRGYKPRDAVPAGYAEEPQVRSALNPFGEVPIEHNSRRGMTFAWEDDGVLVTTLPAPGGQVRPGQLLTLVVKNVPPLKPVQASEGTSGGGGAAPLGGSVSGSHDDDDDFNIPGWLCPTRFC